jgi:phosphoribosylanthranilate isomerase
MALVVKICGLKTPETVEAAIAAGADLVGFVFFPPSPRHLSLSAAKALGSHVAGRAGKVALTVNASDDELHDIVGALAPDMLQLHGVETPERVAAVRTRFGLPVIKALPIATRGDLTPVRQYEKVVDRLLFDARPPRDATRPGGLGTPFDWTLLRGLDLPVPYLLSGGLDAANVAQAIAITGATGVDVSSGVERAPGEKDVEKIRAFVRAARAAVPSDGAAGERKAANV